MGLEILTVLTAFIKLKLKQFDNVTRSLAVPVVFFYIKKKNIYIYGKTSSNLCRAPFFLLHMYLIDFLSNIQFASQPFKTSL